MGSSHQERRCPQNLEKGALHSELLLVRRKSRVVDDIYLVTGVVPFPFELMPV